MRQEKFATLAFEEALKSDQNLKHGSVITKGGKVASKGYNKGNRSKILGQVHSCTHAEIDAASKLVNMLNRKVHKNKSLETLLKKYVVWAVRVCQVDRKTKTYAMKNSKPCKHCINKLVQLGFNKCAYSDDNGNIVHDKLRNMDGYISSSQRIYGKHYK